MRRKKPQPKKWVKPALLLAIGGVGYWSNGLSNTMPDKGMATAGDKLALESVVERPDPMEKFHGEIKPLLESYCFDCHGDGSHKGGLDFDEYPDLKSMVTDREKWLKVKEHLSLQLMPPLDEDQPEEKERLKLVNWIDKAVFPVNADDPDPGAVVMRRLNRNEYRNTIRDLLGADLEVDRLLPLDDTGYGFDTIAEVHTVSSAHIEKYLNAAEVALTHVLEIGAQPFPEKAFKNADFSSDRRSREDSFRFTVNGYSSLKPRLKEGEYMLVVHASSSRAGDEDSIMAVKVDGKVLKEFPIAHGKGGDAQIVVSTLPLTLAQNSLLELGFINDFHDPDHLAGRFRDRNLYIHEVKLIGPVNQSNPQKSAKHLAIFPPRLIKQSDEAYALEVWRNFARRAFRRPVNLDEVMPYRKFLEPLSDGDSLYGRHDGAELEDQIALGLQAMLVSSEFLYIKNSAQSEVGDKSLLTEHALASRLSYFLWSTMPDDRLMRLADHGELREKLTVEIDRLLDDSRSEQFIKNFSGQWLQLRSLNVHTADAKIFPMWDKKLRQYAVTETEMFLSHLLKNNLSVKQCLDADYTFLNQDLAKHYGLKDVQGAHFRQVNLTDDRRGGLLGQASILTLTSNPNRTSPVLRGKWILENILGTPPPPPPADIPEFQPDEKENLHTSLRSQLELHRKSTACASCHNLMDPLGFALENFDAVGRWRDKENGNAIDNQGTLISGESFRGSGELKSVLLSHKVEPFIRCLSEKLMTYSLGRGVEYYDKPAIDEILLKSSKSDHSFRALIHAVCESVPFQQTRTK